MIWFMGALLQNRVGVVLIAILAGVLVMVIAGTHHSELIAPINLILRTATIAAGIFLGLGLSYALATSRSRPLDDGGTADGMSRLRSSATVLMLPIIGGFVGSYGARRAVEAYAFDDIVPVRSTIEVHLVGTGTTRSNPYVVAQAMDGGRQFHIPTTWPAYRAAQSEREKLILPLETGRDGIQRVLLPPARLASADLIPDR